MAEKRIHLFVDAHCLDKEYQGARTFVKELYAVLRQKKDIHFFFAAHDVKKLQETFPRAENITLLSYRTRSAAVRLLIEIPRLVAKHKIDVAHFQYFTPLLKNCRQVVTIHDVLFCDFPDSFPFFYRWVRRILFSRSAKRAESVTTVSGFSQQAIHRHFSIALNKIQVIPNGVHARFFEPYDKQVCKQLVKEKFGFDSYLLCVSRVEPRKNHWLLVKAFTELKLYEEEYHLILIGYRSLPAPELETALSALPANIRRYIHFHEQVETEDLLQLYRAADVFIYPSLAEGFGIPPLEAGAACVPVICSSATAMQAFTFFAPFHVEPSSYAALKTCMEKAITSPLSETSLKNIAAKIRQTYSWETAAEQFYQLIKKTVTDIELTDQKTFEKNQENTKVIRTATS